MHWFLDVRYREDSFRAQNKNLQKNMNMARKLALNLIRIYKTKKAKKSPLSHIMFDCLMDHTHLLEVLGKNRFPCGRNDKSSSHSTSTQDNKNAARPHTRTA